MGLLIYPPSVREVVHELKPPTADLPFRASPHPPPCLRYSRSRSPAVDPGFVQLDVNDVIDNMDAKAQLPARASAVPDRVGHDLADHERQILAVQGRR